MPLVSNSSPSEATTFDGGLRNVGSIHQRAETSHSRNSATTTASRASPGWRMQRALESQRLAHRRLARRSSALTMVLSDAAITTAKAM